MGPEAKIQEAVVGWARKEYEGKLIARKYAMVKGYGTNGWPDYEFLIRKEKVFFIEFKAPGEGCTDLQLQRHKELRALGFRVYVVDNAPLGKSVVKREMGGPKEFRSHHPKLSSPWQ